MIFRFESSSLPTPFVVLCKSEAVRVIYVWPDSTEKGELDLITKLAFNVLGTIFVMIGILGIILPLLPATPFFLLASACYLRGSQRLYGWLMNNRHIGSYIKNFREHRAMPLRAKIITIAILWVSLLVSIYRIEIVLLYPVLIIVGIGVTILILRIRTLKLSP